MMQFGRFDDAFKEVHIALKLDPHHYASQVTYGLDLFLARRYQAAMDQLEHVIADKNFLPAHIILGHVYAKLGESSQGSMSREYFKKAFHEADVVAEAERPTPLQTPAGDTVLPYSDNMKALFYAMSGDRKASLPILSRLEKSGDKMSPVELSQIYAALGEKDKALHLLDQAFVERDRGLFYLKVQPYFDQLRDSPRYKELMKRMSL
jgi:tetratricopeptide (TPR) repeat protein